MSAAKKVIFDRFNGGISDDPREQNRNQFVASGHFDIYSNPRRLTPYRSSEEDTNTNTLEQYEIHDYWESSSSGRLYGMGRQTSFNRPKIFYKTNANVASGTWTLPATAEGGATRKEGCFFEWAGAMWMFSGTTNVSKWVVDSTFTDTVASVGESITSVAQGVISKRDNNAYMFYNDKVVRIDASGNVTDDVVPLPEGYTITSADTWGNYIVISMVSYLGSGGLGDSIAVLWDPTLSNFSDILDIGDGEAKVVANIEGFITVAVDVSMSNSLSIDGGKLAIRLSTGGTFWTEKEIKNDTIIVGGLFLRTKVIKDFKLHFAAQLKYEGSTYQGIWAFGRKSPRDPFALSLAIVEENANTTNAIQGFGNIGNYWFTTVNGDGTIYKTDNSANYTFTSFIETQKFNAGEKRTKKNVLSFFLTCPALPSGGSLVLKYRKDEEASYSTVITETTDNAVESSIGGLGVAMPLGYEIQLKLESTGGAEADSYGFIYRDVTSAVAED